jgi:hypothetical protein
VQKDKQHNGQRRCSDLEAICRRVRSKAISYERYNFSRNFNDFLKAFFDLAQEYDPLEDFYRICIAVPLEITGLDTALYIYDDKQSQLFLVCDSKQGVISPKEEVKYPLCLAQEPYEVDERYLIPVYSKPPEDIPVEEQPKEQQETRQKFLFEGPIGPAGPLGPDGRHRLLGMFAVGPLKDLSEGDLFFFRKYANRIGYNLHNRLISLQNIDHLKFINGLVMDIEHNVIVPNMYFKYLFNQLKKKIKELEALECDIEGLAEKGKEKQEQCLRNCLDLRKDLMGYHEELVKHHDNVSLFLESLFRREHFERGHLVLRPRPCFLEKEVILPQLEHYTGRLQRAGVTVEHPRDMMEGEHRTLVDIGLLAQVYANLFSNGAKYAREIIDHTGKPRKTLAYGQEVVRDFPEPGKKGLKFNVFTTGPHIPEEEQEMLFQEGIRGSNTEGIDGTGHGLSFVRHVIELHGGKVGYEPTGQGNNFYFILPLPLADLPADLHSTKY